jgi:hypothetical protein
MTRQFPALEVFARLGGDLAIDDPVRSAACFEARARDAFREGDWHARNGFAAAADVFERAGYADMERAAEILAAVLQSGARDDAA